VETSARSRRRPGRGATSSFFRSFAAPGVATVLLLAACRESTGLAPTVEPPHDEAQIGPTEQSRVEIDFDGWTGGLRTGAGWYAFEPKFDDAHHGVAWASVYAELYLGRPLADDVELAGIAAPFSYPGSKPQTLTPRLNGHRLATLTLPDGWSEFRTPLPREDFVAGVNLLELDFDHVTSPSAVSSNGDTRTLSVVFDRVAVLPRGTALDGPHTALAKDGSVELFSDAAAWPLPPATRYDAGFAVLRAPAEARLSIDFRPAAGEPRSVWSGAAGDLPRSVQFSVTRPEPGRLTVRRTDGGAEPAVSLSPPALRLDRPTASPAAHPNVFLYLIDTLRADAVGVYGSTRPTTPRIDAFSRDAVVFAEARSSASWTLPATVSILSGVYPSSHGVELAGQELPATARPWLPDLMQRRGYETIGVSQWLLGGSPFGINRGFTRFYMNLAHGAKPPSQGVRWFLWRTLLDRPREQKPAFVYLHVTDPHALYRPDPQDMRFAEAAPGTLPLQAYDPWLFWHEGLGRNPADIAHLRGLYDGEVHAADREFGAFVDQLRWLDLYDASLIVLVSDHGEEFGDHGGFDHGRTLYEELLRVPLIVKFPRSWNLTGIDRSRVTTIDIAATVLAAAGSSSAEAGLEGMDLAAIARRAAGATPTRRALFAETRGEPVHLAAAYVDTVECIANLGGVDRDGRPAIPFEAYDLERDPREQRPLPNGDASARNCREVLARWRARPGLPRLQHGTLTPDDARQLRSLGYIH
jgi:arylsulfatase A-like enzyme